MKGAISCGGYGNDPVNNPAKRITCCQTFTYSDGVEVTYCAACDNTDPPSNCDPRYIPHEGSKGGDIINPKDSGGVLSNNDGSSNSGIPKGIDPITGGTFNEDSNSDNSKGIDPSKIQEGGTFNNDDETNSPSNSENKIDSSNILEGGSFNQ